MAVTKLGNSVKLCQRLIESLDVTAIILKYFGYMLAVDITEISTVVKILKSPRVFLQEEV